MAKKTQTEQTKALVAWLATVLETQCRDGVVELPNGEEAAVRFDAALQTVSLHRFGDEESLLARVRLVVD